MGLIKLALNPPGVSETVEDPKDPRLLPTTERRNPQNRVKPNKTVLNWGMKK